MEVGVGFNFTQFSNMALPILGLLRYVWSAVKIYVLGFIALLRQIFQKHEVPGTISPQIIPE